MVTATVARSSSRVTAAKPVMLLIIDLPDLPGPRDPLGRSHRRFRLSSFEELKLIERRICALGTREELVVPADLDDASAFEHDDRVGATDRRQAVRDDERRAVQH